ncbi:MAG: cytochrome P450 [Myxococcota bacterium]|nr:cytochrome P450 [Myxococcota bacterium]
MPDHPIRDDIRLLDGYWYQHAPFEQYRWMRENAPVYWDPEGEIWGVTRHEDVQLVSRTPEVYCSGKSSRPERDTWIPSMINLDDPDHKRRRNLVNRGFTKRRVDDHEPKIRGIVTDLIDRVIDRGECEFVHEVAAPLPMIVIGDMLGVAPEDRDKLLRWSDDLVTGIGIDDPAIRERQVEASLGYFEYAKRVFADRQVDPTDDLMSVLCHSEIDGEKLTEEEILQESLLILVGGDETTRHVMTEGTEALIRNPAERQKLVDDPSKITVAVEEMLRWVSPIKNMNRTATCDVELRGQKVREGDRLLLLYQAANRDERAFTEPDRFDVERSPNEHVAFGGFGTHFCLGASLARLELRVFFEELLKRLPDLELASDDPLPMRASNFIVGIEEMRVRW